MISLFGASIAASSPWLLLGIPCAIGFLVYIFRVRGTAHNVVVSSLLFLRELPQRPIGRKVFVPPLQFWLELSILALLILAVSGLFLTRSGKHVAIVVDSSLSMGALYGSGGTRLDQAKRIAALDLNRAPQSTNYSVFSSTNELTPLTPPHEGTSEALSALKGVTQSHRADALEEHAVTLLTDPNYDSVWVYTDKDPQLVQPLPRLLVNQVPVEPATQTNAWIRSLRVQGEDSLVVGVGYGGNATRDALLDGECYASGSGSNTSIKIEPRAIKLTPQETATAILSTPTRTWAYCRVHVRLQDASLFDSLPIDNEGWISRASAPQAVRVDSSLSPDQLGLMKIPTMNFVGKATNPSQQLPTIFHRVAPSTPPLNPALVVLPPPGPLPWGGSVLDRAPKVREVTRWNTSSPLLTYTNPSLLVLSEARVLECPPTATAVMSCAAGPIACVGEDRGARYIIIGFEIFPFDGAKSPTLSILTLNIFKWLFQSTGAQSDGPLPSSISIADRPRAVEYVQPTSSSVTFSGTTITPKSPGVIRVERSDTSDYYIALNAFEDSESNLSQITTLSIPSQTSAPRDTTKGNSSLDLVYWLASLALVVITLDLLRRLRHRVKWGDA